ncbi:MAG: type II toxin-antitoxin system VapC family toxin [Synoicihabitans sp.]
MAYLLDTCVLSELRRQKANVGVRKWMEGIPDDEIFVSVLTVGEIRRGIELHRRRDARAATHLQRWLDGLLTHYADRLLPIDQTVADRWGRLSLTQPLPVSDGLIAATALVHDLTVVTRNVGDFERSGAGLLNPFE